MLAQAVNADSPKYLLYDGQGTVRQITYSSGALIDYQSHYYDAYGNYIDWSDEPASNLRYTGQYFDSDAQQYYLRARWYNPSNGLFNRVDPYSGDTQDPQSLHKYLYCHSNPINSVDPLGLFTLPEISISLIINIAMRAWTGYNIFNTVKKAYTQGIGALTFFDWLFLGLDVLHVTSALSWIKMTSTWKKQARLFHSLGEKLAKSVSRARSSVTARLGIRMHEALKNSWLGKAINILQRKLAGFGVKVFFDQTLVPGVRRSGIGSRPDIVIVIEKFKIGLALDLKPVPKSIFYSGVLPSYKWLYTKGNYESQRIGTKNILQEIYGVACLYMYIPYPSFVD